MTSKVKVVFIVYSLSPSLSLFSPCDECMWQVTVTVTYLPIWSAHLSFVLAFTFAFQLTVPWSFNLKQLSSNWRSCPSTLRLRLRWPMCECCLLYVLCVRVYMSVEQQRSKEERKNGQKSARRNIEHPECVPLLPDTHILSHTYSHWASWRGPTAVVRNHWCTTIDVQHDNKSNRSPRFCLVSVLKDSKCHWRVHKKCH